MDDVDRGLSVRLVDEHRQVVMRQRHVLDRRGSLHFGRSFGCSVTVALGSLLLLQILAKSNSLLVG